MVPLDSTLGRAYLKYCVWFWALHFKKDLDKLEQVQRKVVRAIRGLKLSHRERWKDLRMFSLEKRKLRGHMIAFSNT